MSAARRLRRSMPAATGGRIAVLAAAVLALAACGGGTRVDVPAPNEAVASRPLPEPEASVVHVPVTLSLDSVARKVEALVPRGQSREDEWHPLGKVPVAGTLYVKEMWERDPLALELSGDRVEVRTRVRYRARIAERACAPVAGCRWVPLAACGHDGPMPSLRIGLSTTVEYRADWSIVPRTRMAPVEAGVRCRLTRARVDVTGRVQEAVQRALEGVAPRVDEEIRKAVALRSRVEGVWASLQEPISAGSGVYLLLRPESVAVAHPKAEGTRLSTVVSMTMRPKVMLGERPDAAPVPLPALAASVGAGHGFRVAMLAELPYAAADSLLRTALVGREMTVRDHTVRVRGARLYGSGDRLVLAVRVGGDARGTLYFVGTPVYDAQAQVLTVPDLDFSLETKNVVAGTAGWLLHDHLREQVRSAARFSVGDRVAKLRQDVSGAMNRNLSPGVRMRGELDALRPAGVAVTPRSIAALVEAGGTARIDITIR